MDDNIQRFSEYGYYQIGRYIEQFAISPLLFHIGIVVLAGQSWRILLAVVHRAIRILFRTLGMSSGPPALPFFVIANHTFSVVMSGTDPITAFHNNWRSGSRSEEASTDQGRTKSLLQPPRKKKDAVAANQSNQSAHDEMKSMFATLSRSQGGTVHDASKDQHDQLSRDVPKFVSDEEFAYWFDRWVLPMQLHELDFDTTFANLQKLFSSKKTLKMRRYECLKVTCPPLTQRTRCFGRSRLYGDEDVAIAGLQDPTLREFCLRMIRRLDSHAEDTPLTIEDLVNELKNFTTLKMDKTDMEGIHNIHAVWKKSEMLQLRRSTFQKQMPSPPPLVRRGDAEQRLSPIAEDSAETLSFDAVDAKIHLDVVIKGMMVKFSPTRIRVVHPVADLQGVEEQVPLPEGNPREEF
ncbi:unnamed protein product [Strongylus vulgaris]|uniref:Uncharacterized protein n=1 Tax=Strongylus vulgaris TaxID=40348 RepID=A0A3P7IHQ3_STRVU|nr:unnamed protein product [Strongylus vulgaris]